MREAGSLVWTSAARPPSQAAGGRHPQTRVDRKPPAWGTRHRVRRGLAPPTRPQRQCQPRHPPPPDPDPPPRRHVHETRHQSQTLRLPPRTRRPVTNLPAIQNRCVGTARAVVVAVIAGGLLWQISSHPMGEQIDERRVEKSGETAGMLLGAGLSAIWGYAVFRLKKAVA